MGHAMDHDNYGTADINDENTPAWHFSCFSYDGTTVRSWVDGSLNWEWAAALNTDASSANAKAYIPRWLHGVERECPDRRVPCLQPRAHHCRDGNHPLRTVHGRWHRLYVCLKAPWPSYSLPAPSRYRYVATRLHLRPHNEWNQCNALDSSTMYGRLGR